MWFTSFLNHLTNLQCVSTASVTLAAMYDASQGEKAILCMLQHVSEEAGVGRCNVLLFLLIQGM